MSDVPAPDFPETDEDFLRDVGDRLRRPYDDVFLPDGSLLEPMSVLDDPK
jgi:hypothetical protein